MIDFDDEILGTLVFGLIKLVGYALAVAWVARYYRPHKLAPSFVVAISRMLLGALVGWLAVSAFDVDRNLPWYLALVAVRFVEWALVFWFFYERAAAGPDWARLLGFAGFGAMVSCLLDVPAFVGGFLAIAAVYGFC